MIERTTEQIWGEWEAKVFWKRKPDFKPKTVTLNQSEVPLWVTMEEIRAVAYSEDASLPLDRVSWCIRFLARQMLPIFDGTHRIVPVESCGPLTEGIVCKGGLNRGPSKITERPPDPSPLCPRCHRWIDRYGKRHATRADMRKANAAEPPVMPRDPPMRKGG